MSANIVGDVEMIGGEAESSAGFVRELGATFSVSMVTAFQPCEVK